MSDIHERLIAVQERIRIACSKRPVNIQHVTPLLVAVSKTHPKESIIDAYKAGQRHFGENYVQELFEKALDSTILTNCPDIKWHFIGHLQRNKINKVLSLPNLFIIETVDNEKLATTLNSSWERLWQDQNKKLNIFVQVNTSGEPEKSGCKPDELITLYTFITKTCPLLQINGIMTIGKYDNYDHEEGLNPDFQTLIKCRKELCQHLGQCEDDLDLSMGMSGDYEDAIEVGSTHVRVGTAIFGPRNVEKLKYYKAV